MKGYLGYLEKEAASNYFYVLLLSFLLVGVLLSVRIRHPLPVFVVPVLLVLLKTGIDYVLHEKKRKGSK